MASVDRELVRAPEAQSLAQRPLSFHAARIALGVALAVLTYLLFPASPAVDFPVYEVGSVASDNVIAPCDSSRLTGARSIVLDGVGHLSLLFSRRVLDVLAAEAAAATDEYRAEAARRRPDRGSGPR